MVAVSRSTIQYPLGRAALCRLKALTALLAQDTLMGEDIPTLAQLAPTSNLFRTVDL